MHVSEKVFHWNNSGKATPANLQSLLLTAETVVQVLHMRVEHATLPWGSVVTTVKVLPSLSVLLFITLGGVRVLGKTHDA